MSHIAKENNVMFPLADRALGEDDRRWRTAPDSAGRGGLHALHDVVGGRPTMHIGRVA